MCTNTSQLLQLGNAAARGLRRRRHHPASVGTGIPAHPQRRGDRRGRGERHPDRDPPDGLAGARPDRHGARRERRGREGARLRHHRPAAPAQRPVPAHERVPGHPRRPGRVGSADRAPARRAGVPAAPRLRRLPARDPGPAARRPVRVPCRAGPRRGAGRERRLRPARHRRPGDPRGCGGAGARQRAARPARPRRRTPAGRPLARARPLGPPPTWCAGARRGRRARRHRAHRRRRRHHPAGRRPRPPGRDGEPARTAAGGAHRAELHRVAQPGPERPGHRRPAGRPLPRPGRGGPPPGRRLAPRRRRAARPDPGALAAARPHRAAPVPGDVRPRLGGTPAPDGHRRRGAPRGLPREGPAAGPRRRPRRGHRPRAALRSSRCPRSRTPCSRTRWSTAPAR